MVMEEEPSPEFVGREFVRQYYTVLHACPENLHRFYITESSFVHGGLEQPGESTRVARGQNEIHKRIMSLNLRECRAKIRQVDTFETLNGALVIQVIGELGNSGESMRRFVQTFVLVQQSPKSYYVNNDIFRYQDDVFREDESESSVQAKPTPTKQREEAMESSSVYVQSTKEHNDNTNGNWADCEEKKAIHQPANAVPAAPFTQQQNAGQRPQGEAVQAVPFDQQTKSHQNQRNERERIPMNPAPQAVSPAPAIEPVSEQAPAASPQKEPVNKPDENRAPAQSAPASNKPLTFAAVAGGGRTSPAAPAVANNNRQSNVSAGSKPSGGKSIQREKSPDPVPQDTMPTNEDGDVPMAENRHAAHPGNRGNFRQSSAYPNDQQVFVGNLPQDVSDEELQEFMTKFGGVVEVKIVNKPGRQQGGRATPAFAFVTFENVESVDKMMASLPINDFRGQHRLNIERKQERERERSGNFYGGQGGGNYRGQAGQGQAGGRGGMRGGMQGRRFGAGAPRNDNRA